MAVVVYVFILTSHFINIYLLFSILIINNQPIIKQSHPVHPQILDILILTTTTFTTQQKIIQSHPVHP
jgi:hypothetical protein